MTGPRVVGLDLSITATGVAGVDGETFTVGGKASEGDRRLVGIAASIRSLTRAGVDLVVVEDIPTHAHGAGITAMVHGAVRLALLGAGVPYVLVPPATLKKYATGKGNADKTAMAIAALKRAGREFRDDNQCDAAWLRWAGLHALGHPEFDLPKPQTEALNKVTWPQLKEHTPA